MKDNSALNGLPIGEAIIYGRLDNGTYHAIIVSKSEYSFYPIRREAVRLLLAEKGSPSLYFVEITGLDNQSLQQIVTRGRGTEIDEINLGGKPAYDPSVFEDQLQGYYLKYVKAHTSKLQASERKKEVRASEITEEMQREFVDHMDYHLQELLKKEE